MPLSHLGTFEPSQLSLACSCIGATAATSTEFAKETAAEAATETITEVITVSSTEGPEPSTIEPEVSSTQAPEPSAIEPERSSISSTSSTTSFTSSITSSTSEPPAYITSTVPPPPTPPVMKNGDFEDGTLDGWDVISRTGSGDTIRNRIYGTNNNQLMEISISYSLELLQLLEAGKQYRLSLTIGVISSYSNNSPLSIVYGGTTLRSGIGSLMALTPVSYVVACGTTAASNSLQFRMASQTNRAVSLLVDNISAVLI
ncbi:hypothetical protein QBC38DRAFT_505520 [Podospora fimiseda]|uniref:CBM-cenC domain-containing protein n=1 Tax=Podospora fimiseda TaxID=252190 RepID=A0AAN6YMF8_9PEZI|nr:hypothetical protein QBC38DRAFT_505520 [Podospora fimiseda]